MASVFSDHGEEFVQDLVINSGKTFQIGLYADVDGPDGGTIGTTNDITDSSDIADITTEPSGGSYARQSDTASGFTASLDGSSNVTISGTTQTFDVSDSPEEVNAYFVIVPYTSNLVSSDGSETDHLMATGYLDQKYDLSQFDTTVDLDPAELTLN